MAGYDTLGACIFAGFGIGTDLGVLNDLLNARYGWQVQGNILQELGLASLKLEREFNPGGALRQPMTACQNGCARNLFLLTKLYSTFPMKN